MPRRQFMADLSKSQNGNLPLGISNVKAGQDDGHIDFQFVGGPDGLISGPVTITAIVPEVGEYPVSHEYMIYGDDSLPRPISTALERLRGTEGKTVFELLDIVSATLLQVSPDRDGDSQMQDSQLEDEDEGEGEVDNDDVDDDDDDDDNDGDIYDSDHEAFDEPVPFHITANAAPTPSSTKTQSSDLPFRQRIRSDLRATKHAGFKLGHHGHLLNGFNAHVTVSIRMSKLGISEEAMQAWQVNPSEYLILVIHYPNGYKTLEELRAYESHRLAPNIAMRVVAGKHYKPTLQECIKAFAISRKDHRTGGKSAGRSDTETDDCDDEASIRDTFISKPLVNLLQDRLIPILGFRANGLGWYGAEASYREYVKLGAGQKAHVIADKYKKPDVVNQAWPDIMHADHWNSVEPTLRSFPLLAMQFLLRHFVGCTDFCLVCHRKLETEIEAIKPYVCEDNLCLYQYMSLGFGPSIEYELISQPYVVDLLISFCYSSAAGRKLKDFPDGLSLVVPPIDPSAYNAVNAVSNARNFMAPQLTAHDAQPKYEIGFYESKQEILFFDKLKDCPVNRGSWIVLRLESSEGYDFHCRVNETGFYPTISLDKPIKVKQRIDGGSRGQSTPAATRPVTSANVSANWVLATFEVYSQDFINLNKEGKCFSICRLLDTLPTVFEMRDYLSRRQASELKNWPERFSPAALSLLRWIIASNRACIMQVDGGKKDDAEPDSTATTIPAKTVFSMDQDRCFGMSGYMQFRFAMGAPDKEQRFQTEVRNTTRRLELKHPTLFAWHGSPLPNWHTIIREGLHFENRDHGRAYGDGVYHAINAHVSTGYSGIRRGYGSSTIGSDVWPKSVLKAASALALNEIVNAPAEFLSSKPYYVVTQLDWIQTRYLFVQIAPDNETVQLGEEKEPQNPHPQDPTHTPIGVSGNLVIPAAAIKSSKSAGGIAAREESLKNPVPLKKQKIFGGASASKPIVLDDDEDAASTATAFEDLEIFFEEPEEADLTFVSQTLSKKSKGPTTDFVPGNLDFTALPTMPEPVFATSGTTKRLLKELGTLQKVQNSTDLAELGWYIDAEKITNAYQWIVELHSFRTFEIKGKPLPLAEDMKKHKINSLVLEIRFNKDFPYTPPYVRVIRPRFRSIAQGGGGHIVMGGAMCMELLTNTGWSSVSSMESVLLQIRMAIASEPFARLDGHSRGDYGTAEAADGYLRACQSHGWKVPPGFKEMAYGNPSTALRT